MIAPWSLLAALLGLTAVGLLTESIRQGRRADVARALAARWRMNFGRRDTLRLTARVARRFPVPGAASIRVYHVIYGLEDDRYRYVFSVQYTLGLTGPKRRLTRVATFAEPRDRRRDDGAELVLADDALSLAEQYESLARHAVAGTAPVPAGTDRPRPAGP